MSTPTPSASTVTAPPPLPEKRLEQIARDACTLTLKPSSSDAPLAYEHSQTASWNSNIINHIIRALVSETTPEDKSATGSSSPWKFAVNSTIIQHLGTSGQGGKRGMHSAQGAYWNNEKDGMWSWKYETEGFDVILSIVWIAV